MAYEPHLCGHSTSQISSLLKVLRWFPVAFKMKSNHLAPDYATVIWPVGLTPLWSHSLLSGPLNAPHSHPWAFALLFPIR